MLYEIRNYHYDASKFGPYKAWAKTLAVPYLRENLDVVDFWLATDDEPEITGAEPMALKHGSANVTWVIRHASMAARNEAHQRVFRGEGWRKIWAQHPDPGGYLQMEARFAESV